MCYNALVDIILVWKTGGTKSMRKARKRWALILICALIAGIVPVGTAAGSAQAESGGRKNPSPASTETANPPKSAAPSPQVKKAVSPAVAVSGPKIVKNDRMASGQNVTWDSVYFGSQGDGYIMDRPKAEICR